MLSKEIKPKSLYFTVKALKSRPGWLNMKFELFTQEYQEEDLARIQIHEIQSSEEFKLNMRPILLDPGVRPMRRDAVKDDMPPINEESTPNKLPLLEIKKKVK